MVVKNYAGGVACRSCCTEGPLAECRSAFQFTNIYARGTEETWKAKGKEGVEVSAGRSKGFFFCFSSESVECKKAKSEVMQMRHKSDKQ